MIMRFLKKIPAGMMVVPMLLGAIINTFIPEITNIGSFTTAVFTSAGANTAIGIQLFCLGTTLRVRDMGGVVKRGGVLLISKFVIGAVIGIVVGKVFGPTGLLGLSSLAIISAVTNSNGSIYLALMNSYGDKVDQAAMPLLAINPAGHQRRPHADHDRHGPGRPGGHPIHGSGGCHRPHPGGHDPGQHRQGPV